MRRIAEIIRTITMYQLTIYEFAVQEESYGFLDNTIWTYLIEEEKRVQMSQLTEKQHNSK